MQDEGKRQLKQLETENACLKADLIMNHEILTEGYSFLKKLQAQDNTKK